MQILPPREAAFRGGLLVAAESARWFQNIRQGERSRLDEGCMMVDLEEAKGIAENAHSGKPNAVGKAMKVFDFMKRSGELIAQGVPDEEAVAILEREQEEADFVNLDDGAWFAMLDEITEQAEAEYKAEAREQVSREDAGGRSEAVSGAADERKSGVLRIYR